MATIDDVYDRLETLGYAVVPEDDLLINILIDGVESEVLNKCNISEVPTDLTGVIVDVVSGRFLKQKHDAGQLTGYDFTAPISSIKEGDTQISYTAGKPAETTFGDMIAFMSVLPMDQLVKYRRISW